MSFADAGRKSACAQSVVIFRCADQAAFANKGLVGVGVFGVELAGQTRAREFTLTRLREVRENGE